MVDPILRRLNDRRALLMWRAQMLQAEGIEAEGSDVALEAVCDEMEHLTDLYQTMLLVRIRDGLLTSPAPTKH